MLDLQAQNEKEHMNRTNKHKQHHTRIRWTAYTGFGGLSMYMFLFIYIYREGDLLFSRSSKVNNIVTHCVY